MKLVTLKRDFKVIGLSLLFLVLLVIEYCLSTVFVYKMGFVPFLPLILHIACFFVIGELLATIYSFVKRMANA
ncbi:hypothetical protein [Weissella confusa]|uniref:hypothetical protein n=1 Tax=Weissella confusa TaxID=1583 RepID=UPI0018F123A3|nr:hypothetical protein [Weissella confusa]MBJ7617585.1 hypothetical protein [Weissella confusa]MBJ7624442.1 hypothetical protein [Weissella confusa]MBJ7650895.1 hypothetical protein [Weissella confusa]MBJ7657033.1 hypothetical protein [Weissella confusa]MBJ7665021.1 hypothetical protein [Weissella confusa]